MQSTAREVIHQGNQVLVYRSQGSEGEPTIIKTYQLSHLSPKQVAQLKHEYNIASQLEHEHIVRAIRLETREKGQLSIEYEDQGGQSLKQYIATRTVEIAEFLAIAIPIAKAIDYLHSKHIIHKDIKPANIIINPETKTVKLTDFSISSQLSKETTQISNPDQLEGTLAYMSPEQTGRMNRTLDYRTDFYSLGITCYEILTKQQPFPGKDALEIVYGHIAKPIPELKTLRPGIPTVISAIIKKLMSKNAEDRYQTANGLIADLETCQSQLQETGQISEFEPGRLDILSQLLIPAKLYGREAQVSSLLEAFKRITKGSKELVLVSGYSGVGKSSVVNEIKKPITQAKGYFISGKFDQFQRDIPYAALIKAFSPLMQQLLTESKDKLELWKQKILEAVGNNGQVIVEVIPQVEFIIGKQSPVAELGGVESQNRFQLVFGKFIKVFAQPEHPLALFVDDLQWADNATLKLMELWLSDTGNKYLLIIAAYRDNEVNAAHPLMQTLERLKKTGIAIEDIVLQPLERADIHQLTSDTLKDSTERIDSLVELFLHKAGGNPFFITQLLYSLHQEELLTFNFTKAIWQWDIEAIQKVGITDRSIVELVVSRLQNLSTGTQRVLTLGACIGTSFSLDTLAVVSEQSAEQVAAELYPALQQGLILPLSEAYRIPLALSTAESAQLQFDAKKVSYTFLHDRVQQAAYSLIPDSKKQETHLSSGYLLLQKTYSEELAEQVIDIVNQLNVGSGKVNQQSKREKLVQLNLLAAKKALIPDSEKQGAHLSIGYLLLQDTKPEDLADRVIDIVNQLNMGIGMITQHSKREELAGLNLLAAKKAKKSNAYNSAIKYCQTGIGLLGLELWENHYEMALDLHLEEANALYVSGSFESAMDVSNIILKHCRTVLDKVKAYELQIQLYKVQNRMAEASKVSLIALELLGLKFPKNPNLFHVLVAFIQTKLVIGRKCITDLENLPQMTDPYKLAVVRIIVASGPASSMIGSLYFPLLALRGVRIPVQYGNIEVGYSTYSVFGAILCDKFNDIENGYQFGNLSTKLTKKMNSIRFKCQNWLCFYGMIWHFKFPVREIIEPLTESIHSGLEVGDIEYVGYISLIIVFSSFLCGQDISEIDSLLNKFLEIAFSLKIEVNILTMRYLKEVISNLQEYVLTSKIANESEILDGFGNNYTWLTYIHTVKSFISYLSDDYAVVIQATALVETQQVNNPGFFIFQVANFLHSLALLGNYPNVSRSEQKQYLKKVSSNQKKMKLWAHHAPCNYQHKYDLVAAELARIKRKNSTAAELYDKAAAGAKANQYTHEEAIAYELAAKFYLKQRKEKIAATYMSEAYRTYLRWGAKAKANQIQQRYPELIQQNEKNTSNNLSQTNTSTLTSTGSSTSSSQILDIATAIKASSAITSEIRLDKLLGKLLNSILENAGASKGCLILEKDHQLYIEAQQLNQDPSSVTTPSIPLETSPDIPITLIEYITRTQQTIVIADAVTDPISNTDPYIIAQQPLSLLVAPIIYQNKFTGIFYLENNLTTGAFTPERLELLKLLTSQAAIALENARLYSQLQTTNQELEQRVEDRTIELKAAKQIADNANNAKSEFLANMSHELRTPLNGIMGYAQILEYSSNLNPKEQKGIGIIRQCGSHLLMLINDVLDLSKIEARKMELFPSDFYLPSFLQSIIEIMQVRAEQKDIALHYQPDSNLPLVVSADEKRLRQVLINLLGNAVKFTDTGNVTFSVKVIGNPPNKSNQAGFYKLQFAVTDTGVGISADGVSKLFNPFVQVGDTKRQAEGTGLGLALSQKIVNLMGGKIQVQSQFGVGSTFSFEIELSSATDLQLEITNQDGRHIVGYVGQPHSILVVDDRWENRSVLASLLKPLGFVVTEAENGVDALAQMDKQLPDLVIADLKMPVMDGFELLRQMRRSNQLKDLCVIVSSASVIEEERRQSLRDGGDDFLPKPIETGQLFRLLERHLQLQWQYLDSPAEDTALSEPAVMVAPPLSDLQQLFAFSKQGRIQKLIQLAEQIQARDPQYTPFIQQILRLAEGFAMEKIEAFIHSFVN